MKWSGSCALLGILLLGISSIVWVTSMMNYQDSPISGQGPALPADKTWMEYGWYDGKQRVLLIDLTDIGGVGHGDRCTKVDWVTTPYCGIDYTDKRKVKSKLYYRDSSHATPQYYACEKCTQANCEEYDKCNTDNATLWQYTEIEFKGDAWPERRQANFDLEFGDDITPFDFTEKTDDWVLRGSYLDRGLVRDATASIQTSSSQRPYETQMVDLIFLNDGKYTYEGAYNMMHKIKRGTLRNFNFPTKWNGKGKVHKCTDLSVKERQDMSILYKAEECNRKNRGKCSKLGNKYQLKILEPKQYVFESDDNPDKHKAFANCTTELEEFYSDYFAVPEMLVGYKSISLDYRSFAIAFLQCQLMQQTDFGYQGASFYFVKLPKDPKLYAGPLYDFDAPMWRVMPIESLDFYNNGKKNNIWQEIASHPEFLNFLRQHGATVLNETYTEIDNLYATRLRMATRGEFDQHTHRWPMGKVASSFVLGYYLLHGTRLYPEHSVREEIAAQKLHLSERYRHMQRQLPKVQKIATISYNETNLFLQQQWWLILCLLLGIFLLVNAFFCYCRKFYTSFALSLPINPPPITVVSNTHRSSIPMRELDLKRHKERYR